MDVGVLRGDMSRVRCHGKDPSVPSEIGVHRGNGITMKSVMADENLMNTMPKSTVWSSHHSVPAVVLQVGDGVAPPDEPNEAPPMLRDLIRIVVVGDAEAGKTNLVHSFVYRRSHTSTSVCYTSVDYHKKDMTFWLDADSDDIQCARLQIWDVSLWDNENVTTLLDKADIVFCVISSEHGPSPLLDSMSCWKHRLRHLHKLTFLVHKSDLLSLHQVPPKDWIQWGSRIATESSSFYLTSCCDPSSVQDAFMTEVRGVLKSRHNVAVQVAATTDRPTSPVVEARAVPIYSLRQISNNSMLQKEKE